MHKSVLGLAGLFIALLGANQAMAWSHSSAWGHSSGGGGNWSASGDRGGSASGGGGSWNASNWRGSASGGSGSWNASSKYGGSASGGDGSWNASNNRGSASGGDGSWNAQGRYGNSASGYRNDGYGTTNVYHNTNSYGTSYYHPPTSVYYNSGCYDCNDDGVSPGAAAAVGVLAGAAIANRANMNAEENAYNSANYNNSNSYGAGYQAGLAAATSPTLNMGSMFASLPSGCHLKTVAAGTYYECGNSWVKPSYGANGVYYTVVPQPY